MNDRIRLAYRKGVWIVQVDGKEYAQHVGQTGFTDAAHQALALASMIGGRR